MTKVPSNVVRCLDDNGPILYPELGSPYRCANCGGTLKAGQRPEGYWTESYGYLVEVEVDDEGLDTEEAVEELGGALRVLARVLGDGMTASGVGGHFTCTEADDLAQALMVGGHKRQAMRFLEGHAEGDDDEDDLHGSVEDFEAYVLELAGLPVPELIEEPERETEPKEHDLPTVTVEELIVLIGL